MNWFDKIKELTTKQDKSPELKKGEIKQILIETANEFCPDFHFLDYKNSYYTFQRIKKYRTHKVYELVHIGFTLKDNFFAVSVASRLNPTYLHNNTYNGGLINPHSDLISLKRNFSAIPLEETYYYHNGHVDTTGKIVKQIFQDFNTKGLSFINQHFIRLNENEIVKAGFDFLDSLNISKQLLQNEIETELRNGKHLISSIRHPTFIQLKEYLQAIPDQEKEERKLIPKTTLELLEVYWAT